ncbi:carboxypeptidase regulatory-like domain-containing protein [Myxococcus sp. CA039A]|uniref:carboxypeptidase regulatory-like domain-containing protein n=1 Tax=Myxococcus sp. CA039A TaxID=2741737 RepID=UPI00157A4FFD|nr:carboxypeptidase regulatory-like domain-containing protein [Myxococcus sp. CA039A]NTX53236.1 carboxypeptidase regulatory-like domain-containing protein [Myxococcus sp. CA039A]
MRRWFGIGAGLLLLTLFLGRLLLGGTSVDGRDTGKPSSSGLGTEGRGLSWRALLAAPVEAPRGELRVRGVVLGPDGPVEGAVVVATEAKPDMPLLKQPCDCGEPCELLLLSTLCRTEGLLDWLESGAGETPPLARTTTDAEGHFTLAGLEAGRYAVWAEGPRGVGLSEDVAAGGEEVEVRLGGEPPLSGQVRDEFAQPVEGVRVTAILVAHNRAFEVSTTLDGRFQFASLPFGDYNVLFSKEGLLPQRVQLRGTGMQRLDVMMPRARRLSGRVVMGDVPIPGASVRCGNPYWTRDVVTDDQGRFTFEALRPDQYSFSATHGDAVAEERVGLAPGGDYPEVVLALGNALLLPVEVRDSRGAPIVGASISAWLMGTPAVPLEKRGTTDARGAFTLGPLLHGIYAVNVEAPGFLDHNGEVRLGADTVPFAIVLRDAVTVEGTVVDAEGRPLAGASLALRSARDLSGPFDASVMARDDLELESSAKTEEDGSFLLTSAEAGEHGLVVTHDAHRPTWLPVTSPRKGLRVVLTPGATVSGEVLSETGAPVRSAQVDVVPVVSEVAGAHDKRAFTDARGRFALQGIEEGRHHLVVTQKESETLRQLTTPIEVRGLQPVYARLQFLAGLSLSGVVEDGEGRPVDGAQVRAQPAGKAVVVRPQSDGSSRILSHPGPSTGKTDEGGRFTLSHLVPGAYSLTVRGSGYSLDATRTQGASTTRGQTSVPVEAGDAEVRLVMRRDVGIRGRLVREDGTPVTRFQLWDGTVTNARGEFFRGPLTGGKLTLHFSAPGFAKLSLTVEVVEGQSLDLGAVVLHQGRPLRGRVTDAATGRPVAGALVDVGDVPEDAEGWERQARPNEEAGAARTRQDGTFTLPHVMERPYALVVTHASYSQKRLLLGAGQDEVAVALDAGATLRGTVSGLKTGDATVVLSGAASGFRREVRVVSGRFEQGSVPPGTYLVAVQPHVHEEEEPASRPVFMARHVQVPATGTVTVDFEARRDGVTLHLRVEGACEDSVAILVPGSVPAPSTPGELVLLQSMYSRELAREGGGWTFRSQPEGAYTAFVFRKDAQHPFSVVREELTLPGTGEVTLELPPSWTLLPEKLLMKMEWN